MDVDLVGDPGLSVFDDTPANLDYLAGVYGSYPFEAIGAIVDVLWNPPPGDPGADNLFETSVYLRGAMTLHVLRTEVGDEAFFETLREWVAKYLSPVPADRPWAPRFPWRRRPASDTVHGCGDRPGAVWGAEW